jgi:hypothetical protein
MLAVPGGGVMSDEPSPKGWEGLWKLQRDLCEQNRRDARKYCLWAWFWFAFSVAKTVADWVRWPQ